MDITNKIQDLINSQATVFLSSIDACGYPNTRAMLAPRLVEETHIFYFHTNTSSMHVAQYQSNGKACLYLCDPESFIGILLVGEIELAEDYKTMLWQEGDELYYSKGIQDPDYCVLRFTAASARLYQNFSSHTYSLGS